MLGQNGVLASYREREKKCNTELDLHTVNPLMKETLKEDKPPNKGQGESTHVYIHTL